jgi:hypothetical protein
VPWAGTPVIQASYEVRDVGGKEIAGAVVAITIGSTTLQAVTGTDGVAQFASIAQGESTVVITAAGFEERRFTISSPVGRNSISLNAVGEWAVGRAMVLGSRVLDRAGDGSALTFSVDLAVVDGNSAAIGNLAAADFQVVPVDCGWGGPRNCASDVNGAQAGQGAFLQDGSALDFGFQTPALREPYIVGLLMERGRDVWGWQSMLPALKTYFTSMGGNDAANLAVVEVVNGASVLNVLGPYARDGRSYLPLIDQLAMTDGEMPALAASIEESIRLVAAARDTMAVGARPHLVVLSRQGLTVPEFSSISAKAQLAGVRVGVIEPGIDYGLTEIAVRTGGFIAQHADPRQLQIISGALDSLLAGSQPFYRVAFRIKGSPGTFVAGGNAKVWMKISVPTTLPTRGIFAQFDVAIP